MAMVAVINKDLSLSSAYVAKAGNSFAHGETLREAMQAAIKKDMEERPLDERIDAFVETHPDLDTLYGDLFQWHHTLTGSCEFGRKQWCKDHGYQPSDAITVRTFIEGTRNDYGGEVIKQLAERYKM